MHAGADDFGPRGEVAGLVGSARNAPTRRTSDGDHGRTDETTDGRRDLVAADKERIVDAEA
jgi:hypothetical protein